MAWQRASHENAFLFKSGQIQWNAAWPVPVLGEQTNLLSGLLLMKKYIRSEPGRLVWVDGFLWFLFNGSGRNANIAVWLAFESHQIWNVYSTNRMYAPMLIDAVHLFMSDK